jgi:hypothetical protein
MSLVTDQKYASMLGPYVRNFHKKNNAYNFSCPVCGDSKKHLGKARGYLYPGKDRLLYKCHNCAAPSSLYKLLMAVDPNLAKEYITDRFIEDKQEAPPEEKPFAPPKFHDTLDKALTKISALPPGHYAKNYVEKRQIPSKMHYKLFHVDNFKAWANTIVPETFKEITSDEPRLIIPLIDRHQKVMGYQGRSYRADHPIKYITILVDPQAIKIYGLDSIDLNRTIRAFEGPIDAMFIDNAVATTGGRQDTLLQQAGVGKDRTTLIYDNEPRNIHTIEKMKKGLDAGWTVCIWPDDMIVGDVNEMIKKGYTAEQVTEIIDSHAFTGLMGLAMLSHWRKV